MFTNARRPLAWLACALVTIALGCKEAPTSPPNAVHTIALGAVTDGSLGASDSARIYTFGASGGSAYTVFVKLLDLSRVWVDLQDSLRSSTIASVLVQSNLYPLDQNAAIAFTAPSSGSFLLAVRPYPAGQSAHFQLQVLAVSEAPESRAAVFAIGDTVAGEALRPVGDVDVFSTHVGSAQDIVVVAAAPDSTGLGPLELTIADSSGGPALATLFFPTGVPASLTSGRIHLPAAGTYRFRFEDSSATTLEAFHGPYRFSTYAVNHGPEHATATVATGTVIGGESIDRVGDVDEFTFASQAGAEVNAFFQCPATAHLEILTDAGVSLGTVSGGPDPSLYTKFTGRIALPKTGTYTVRVASDGNALADTGAYRFFLYPINRQPETVSATVTPGDSVMSEAIDLPGDVDEFTLAGAPGQQFYAFLQARSGKANSILEVDAVDAGGATLATQQSRGTDTTLLGHVPAGFTMPSSGSVRLRVWGAPGPASGSYGPYRLFVWPVSSKPEVHTDTLAFVDSIVGEAIDVPGDVDEYRYHVPIGSGADLVFTFPGTQGSTSPAVMAEVIDSATGKVVAGTYSVGDRSFGYTGGVALGPGTQIVRVHASSGANPPFVRGPYRLWLYGFRLGPEHGPDTIAVGDTVEGESIDVPGDVDTYHFYGRRGDHINVMLQGLVSPWPDGFVAVLNSPSTLRTFVVSPPAAGALSDHQTGRLDLAVTGWYSVTVSGAGPVDALNDTGTYRLAVAAISSSPEHVSSTLAIGDSLTAEAIDFVGDWDQFTVAATPGQELNILFWGNPACCAWPRLVVFDPATWDTLATSAGQGWRVSEAVRVPSGGQIVVAVYGSAPTFGDYTGPYVLQVLPLNRAPEIAPAAYTLGDTVRTEAILPAGDIDEFTLTATPGDTLTAYFRLPANPAPAGSWISMEPIDSATGHLLIGSPYFLAGASSQFNSTGPFVVPTSGRVLLRFRGTGNLGGDPGTGPYEFFVKRGS